MATYLKGSNKYIPQIQPYQPDFNFYKTVLDTKTAQYEAGYDRVNSIYGTLLNSPLTRQDTSTMRNDFFSKANNEIQRLAGVDLSMEDNQRAAFQVFKPLTTNKLFAKDVNFTKDVYNEYDRAEFFRNCLNPKDCGGKYWDGGVQYLQYKAQDFANATEQEAMNMSAPKYVPFVNVVDDAVDFAIKSKLEMQTVSSDGRYIYTTTNGTPMEAPLYNYFLAKYGNEQQVADMYNVSAYLQRKNYGQEKAAEFGSEEAAEADYIRQVIDAENKANRESKIASQENKETINAKKTVVEDYIKQNGVDSDEDQDLIEYYRRLNDDEAVADETDNYYTQSLDITSPTALEGLSQSALAARADAILARGLLSKDLANAATSYAQLTQKQDVKADPIYLENLNFSHQVSLKGMEIENQWRKAAYDYANDLEKKLIDSRLKTDLKPTAYQKSLGLLNGATAAILDQFAKTFDGEEDDVDTIDEEEDTKKRSKSPAELAYEMQLQENAMKQKELRENELEFYIHQLRGHGSEAVWNSMGAAKLSMLGITKKEDIAFLDSGDVQQKAAEQAGISTGGGQGAQQTQQAPSGDGTQVQTPPADSTAVTTNIPTNLPDSTAAPQTEQQVSTELPTDTSSVATTDSIPFSQKYANPQVQAQATQQGDPFAGLQTQQDIDELNEYAQASNFEKLFNPRAQEFNRALEASVDSSAVEQILKAGEQYSQFATGADSLSGSLKNILRTDIRASVAGTKSTESSLMAALMPYQLIASDKETTVGAIDPTTTEEFKNIQLPNNESFISALWDSGLALTAEKIRYKNAITAGTFTENPDITDFKAGTVDFLLSKYQDKVQNGTPSEKKSALSTIKKMFPGAARMGLIGDDGQIKNSDIFPYMKLGISSSENFDKIVNEYEKDPMFRNDPDKLSGKISEQLAFASQQSQTEKAMQIIDQYNIAKIGDKMETNPGMIGNATGTEVRDFMNKYIFKQMGNINAPNSPANGAALKAVRSREDFEFDIYNNPKIQAAASVIADAAIVNADALETNANTAVAFTSQYSNSPMAAASTYGAVLSKNPLNPNISKRFAEKANKALGKDPDAWFFNKGFSGNPADVSYIVNQLNQNGLNGKALLEESIMETWTSEGRTTEWNVYQSYATAMERKGAQPAYLEFPEIPVVGYDTFSREYGIAAADKNTDLQTYSPRNLIADTYKGQGGLTAQPYGINFNEGVELAVATGNQDFIGLIDNLKQSISSVDRKTPYNQRSYLLNMPYADVLNKLNISDETPAEWSWDSYVDQPLSGKLTFENLYETMFSETIEGNHKKNSEKLLNLLGNLQTELKNQGNLGNFGKLDLLEGQIKTYPIGAGTAAMTAYEIILNGEKAKSMGYQQDNKDLVFTALIPRTQATNSLYKRTTNNDWVDLALWATGKAVIDVPGSGMVTITQDAEDNYVMNGQIYTLDEINGLTAPQQLESQRASKGTLPGYLFANQLMEQLINNFKYQAQLKVNTKAQKTNLEKNPYKLLERPNA